MKYAIVLFMLLFSGCTNTMGLSHLQTQLPSSAYPHDQPPSPADYNLSSAEGVRAYTTAMNWYLHQTYNYVRALNITARDYGWLPPANTDPICILYPTPRFGDVPDVNIPTQNQTPDGLALGLSEHIKKLKALYNQQKENFGRHMELQRKTCIY